MDFELTEEQSILKDTLRRYLQDQHDFEARGHALRDPLRARPLWDGLAQMGLMGAPFAEEVGGFGGGPVEAMIVQEALGEALVCAPWSETVILCGRLLEAIATPASLQLLADLVSGQARPALAHWEPQARNGLHHVATTARPDNQAGASTEARRSPLARRMRPTFSSPRARRAPCAMQPGYHSSAFPSTRLAWACGLCG